MKLALQRAMGKEILKRVSNLLIWGGLLNFLGGGCALDHFSFSDPVPSQHFDDEDFKVDLWPEAEENQGLTQTEVSDSWEKVSSHSVLFLGDESLHGNWGLLLKTLLVEESQKSHFISGCFSAYVFKSGGLSLCGLWTEPLQSPDTQESIYMTLDQTSDSERYAPRVLMEKNVEEVVISFGHRIPLMSNPLDVQMELSAIELLAKWSHSAGKKCYVIEPVGKYYLEVSGGETLSEEQKLSLKTSIEPYCRWVSSQNLKNKFLKDNHINLETSSGAEPEDSNDYFIVNQPQVDFIRGLRHPHLDSIENPQNQLVEEDGTSLTTAEDRLRRKRSEQRSQTPPQEERLNNKDEREGSAVDGSSMRKNTLGQDDDLGKISPSNKQNSGLKHENPFLGGNQRNQNSGGRFLRDQDEEGPRSQDLEVVGHSDTETHEEGPGNQDLEVVGHSDTETHEEGPGNQDLEVVGHSDTETHEEGPESQDLEVVGHSDTETHEEDPEGQDLEVVGHSDTQNHEEDPGNQDLEVVGHSDTQNREEDPRSQDLEVAGHSNTQNHEEDPQDLEGHSNHKIVKKILKVRT